MRSKRLAGGVLKMSVCVLLLSSSACHRLHPRLNNSDRLMKQAGFREAATASPEWVSDALMTINSLEYELERR